MKNLFVFLFLAPILTLAQTGKVGVNTDKPTHTLDVNGTLRVRDIQETKSNSSAKDSIMVFEGGVVKRISANQIAAQTNKYISINEFIRDEPILKTPGHTFFVATEDLKGYKLEGITCSVHSLSTTRDSGTLSIKTIVTRKGAVQDPSAIIVSFDSTKSYSASASGGSFVLDTGDLLSISVLEAPSSRSAPKGLSCTFKLTK